jgi:hypothetical protein
MAVEAEVVSNMHGVMDSGEVFAQSALAKGMAYITVQHVGERMIHRAVQAQIAALVDEAMRPVAAFMDDRLQA